MRVRHVGGQQKADDENDRVERDRSDNYPAATMAELLATTGCGKRTAPWFEPKLLRTKSNDFWVAFSSASLRLVKLN